MARRTPPPSNTFATPGSDDERGGAGLEPLKSG
jgi:hypothetical protein